MHYKDYFQPVISKLFECNFRPKQKLGLIIGMQPWKNFVGDWIFEEDFIQIQRHFNKTYFKFFLKPFIRTYNPTIYIWGYKAPQFFIDYIRRQDLDVFFLEDGFIRSTPDDDKSSPPLSIVIDSQAPYFDTTRPNDLTDLITNFDFEQAGYDERLTQEMLKYFVSHRVSKYNHQDYVDVKPIYGRKNKYRILVLGQVANDDSLKYGGGEGISLIDLTNAAIRDYPNAQIIVKPHPISLKTTETLEKLKQLDCILLDSPLHLVDALETIDHVYTITSLGGFEALLRGKEVTVLGKPFYNELCKLPNIKTQLFFYLVFQQHQTY